MLLLVLLLVLLLLLLTLLHRAPEVVNILSGSKRNRAEVEAEVVEEAEEMEEEEEEEEEKEFETLERDTSSCCIKRWSSR